MDRRFRLVLLLIVGLCVWATAAAAGPSENDRVVQRALNRFASHVRIWHRATVTDDLDLVVARDGGMAPPEEPHVDGSVWLNGTIGLVLQERVPPFRAFIVTAAQGQPDCSATLLRATSTEVVFRCEEEKGPGPILKFVYDIRSKRLVSRLTFDRYRMDEARVVGSPGRRRARIVGGSGTERVALEFTGGDTSAFRVVARGAGRGLPSGGAPTDCGPFGPSRAFRLVPEDDARWWIRSVESRLGDRRLFRLPQSTRREYVQARLMRTPKNDAHPDDGIDEWIGPCQVMGGRLWFGRAFYEGESASGVGGVGYFAPEHERYTLFTGDAIADWSTTALCVESDAVWLALESAGEWGSERGGIVRFDRRTKKFERISDDGGIGRQFLRFGEDLLVVTDDGVTVVRDGRARHFIVDRTTDGRLRVVENMTTSSLWRSQGR